MAGPRWYLLIHQLPPKPLYLRAKIRQRLAKVGALALKNSVYVLPRKDDCLEDLQWIAQEAVTGGGEAWVCEGGFVAGISNDDLVKRFQDERQADYAALSSEITAALATLKRRSGAQLPEPEVASRLERLKKRFSEIEGIDFFKAAGRRETGAGLRRLEDALRPKRRGPTETVQKHAGLIGKTWVTRRGIQVDRIASAWLVRRFVDPNARFRFVEPKGAEISPDEIRFDMMPGEITHEGDRCTFETLVHKAGIADSAVREIAEIVHDIDLKDGKFGRADAAGIQRLVVGLVLAQPEDEARLTRGFALFDDLYQSFSRAAGVAGTPPRKTTSKGGSK
jgi:hypothetical protein